MQFDQVLGLAALAVDALVEALRITIERRHDVAHATWSVWLDLEIIVRTVAAVIGARNAH